MSRPSNHTSRRRRAGATLGCLVVLAALVAACTDDSGDVERSRARSTTTTDGIDSLEAEAKAAAVEFFEAQATLDHDTALARSSGAAARGVEWARAVNAIDEVPGTPYEVRAAPSPKTTVVIDRVSRADDDRLTATGYLEIDQRPGLLAAGPIPPDIAPLPTWFVTDLVFTERDGRLVVDDYRMDDSPYPVSQLVASFDPPAARVVSGAELGGDDAERLARSIRVERGHRDIDDTVQYTISFETTPLDLAAAAFVATDRADVPLDAEGATMQIFRDRRLGAPNASTTITAPAPSAAAALVVGPGGFPGATGVLRLTFVRPGSDAGVVIDAPVRDWPPLTELPTNQVRRAVAPATTTTTTTTTTAPPTSIVVVPVPGDSPEPPPTAPTPTMAPTTTARPTSTTSTTTTSP